MNMNRSLESSKAGWRSGFSLIEVALAVAVIAVGFLAIMGLFPQGIQSSRNAVDNTLSATIVQDLFSRLRSGDFTNTTNCQNPDCTLYTVWHMQNLPLVPVVPSVTSFYDQDGFLTVPPSQGGRAAYFRVILYAYTLPPDTFPHDLAYAEADVLWPETPSGVGQMNTNIFMTEIARFNNP